MSLISNRLSRFKPSLTVKISQKARELSMMGEKIISLSSGEPDFDTPEHIKSEAISAINEGFTKYTQVDGVNELKESIQRKFLKENNLNYSTNQITVGVGGKHVIYNLFMSSIDQGDEVVIASPYWVSYPDIVSLCRGKPVLIESDSKNKFKITPDMLEKNINKNTKWFVINSPCNPTGTVYSREELIEISKVLINNPHVNILSDDIYEHIIYGNKKFYNILNVAPELYERTFIVNGVSKAFSMTGWRIGYGAGDEKLIKSIAKIQSQSTTNPCSISQMAAKFALDTKKTFLNDWIKQFEERKNFLIDFFNPITQFEVINPEGAFYLFVGCEGFMQKKTPDGKIISNDVDFSEFILTDSKVAIVPGIAFGKSPYFRISYATSLDDLKLACERIKGSISKIL